jgi:hypothetical protein
VMGARPTRKASVCRSGRPLDGLAGRTSDPRPTRPRTAQLPASGREKLRRRTEVQRRRELVVVFN